MTSIELIIVKKRKESLRQALDKLCQNSLFIEKTRNEKRRKGAQAFFNIINRKSK